MKLLKILLFIFILFIIPITTNASNFTFSRTDDNLLLPRDVEVNESNRESIMKTPAVSSSDKIYDFVDLFTDKQEEKIKKDLEEYIDYTKMDAIVIATNDLSGFNMEEYSYNFYDYNDFKDDGVILLIYVGKEDVSIYMGNSGRSVDVYTDSRINSILEYIYENYIREGNYYLAVGEYIKILNGFYDIDSGGNYKINANGVIVKNIQWFDIIVLSLSLSFLFIMLIYYRVKNKNKLSFYDGFYNSIDTSSMVVKTVSDSVISSSEN